jgi:hypothetical protein
VVTLHRKGTIDLDHTGAACRPAAAGAAGSPLPRPPGRRRAWAGRPAGGDVHGPVRHTGAPSCCWCATGPPRLLTCHSTLPPMSFALLELADEPGPWARAASSATLGCTRRGPMPICNHAAPQSVPSRGEQSSSSPRPERGRSPPAAAAPAGEPEAGRAGRGWPRPARLDPAVGRRPARGAGRRPAGQGAPPGPGPTASATMRPNSSPGSRSRPDPCDRGRACQASAAEVARTRSGSTRRDQSPPPTVP